MLEDTVEVARALKQHGVDLVDASSGGNVATAQIPIEPGYYDPQDASHPTIGVDWEFHVGRHESNWILERHIVREHGIVVWGPPPDTLIDPVTPQELRAAVCEKLRSFWSKQFSDPEWLRARDYQAFAVLTLCRALYTLRYGDVVSKPKAAAWACLALDPQWRPIIERALIWRKQHVQDDMTETLEFLRFAVARGLELCGE